jgi:hypothetical protein
MTATANNGSAEALSVESRGEHLLAVHFSALGEPCEVLFPSREGRPYPGKETHPTLAGAVIRQFHSD